jgi:hypothetical protein
MGTSASVVTSSAPLVGREERDGDVDGVAVVVVVEETLADGDGDADTDAVVLSDAVPASGALAPALRVCSADAAADALAPPVAERACVLVASAVGGAVADGVGERAALRVAVALGGGL